jgi:hypothetical protein
MCPMGPAVAGNAGSGVDIGVDDDVAVVDVVPVVADCVVASAVAGSGREDASAQQARQGLLAAHAAEQEPSLETTAVATGQLRGVEP